MVTPAERLVLMTRYFGTGGFKAIFMEEEGNAVVSETVLEVSSFLPSTV